MGRDVTDGTAGTVPAGGWKGAGAGLVALVEATQPRITGLVVLMAAAGLLVAAGTTPAPVQAGTVVALCLGTTLACGGTNALNQWLERRRDARMRRTRGRPLPSGRLSPRAGVGGGVAVAGTGIGVLWTAVGPGVAGIAVLTTVLYLGVYTPLKIRTPWATWIGTLPGALPVLGGWMAAAGGVGTAGWMLFAAVAAWQVPHVHALGWLHREDYARGGFAVLPVGDPGGERSAREMVVGAGLATGIGAWLFVPDGLGIVASLGGLAGGLLLVVPAVRFLRTREDGPARALFRTSLLYLPVMLGGAVLDALVA